MLCSCYKIKFLVYIGQPFGTHSLKAGGSGLTLGGTSLVLPSKVGLGAVEGVSFRRRLKQAQKSSRLEPKTNFEKTSFSGM
jgi:hypothetical protein